MQGGRPKRARLLSYHSLAGANPIRCWADRLCGASSHDVFQRTEGKATGPGSKESPSSLVSASSEADFANMSVKDKTSFPPLSLQEVKM